MMVVGKGCESFSRVVVRVMECLVVVAQRDENHEHDGIRVTRMLRIVRSIHHEQPGYCHQQYTNLVALIWSQATVSSIKREMRHMHSVFAGEGNYTLMDTMHAVCIGRAFQDDLRN